MDKAYRKQKTMPLSSQSEDKEVRESGRQGSYDESESALSPPVDSQASHAEHNKQTPQKPVAIQQQNVVQNQMKADVDGDGDEDDYSEDAEF